jgi:hypothetical protein
LESKAELMNAQNGSPGENKRAERRVPWLFLIVLAALAIGAILYFTFR